MDFFSENLHNGSSISLTDEHDALFHWCKREAPHIVCMVKANLRVDTLLTFHLLPKHWHILRKEENKMFLFLSSAMKQK